MFEPTAIIRNQKVVDNSKTATQELSTERSRHKTKSWARRDVSQEASRSTNLTGRRRKTTWKSSRHMNLEQEET